MGPKWPLSALKDLWAHGAQGSLRPSMEQGPWAHGLGPGALGPCGPSEYSYRK